MHVALIASPFISVPPRKYGGTELFISNLANGLQRRGVHPIVYTNGASTVKVEKRWCYEDAEWPLATESSGMFKELEHVSWSIEDAARECDLIHINSAPAITYSRFVRVPFVCTLHHPYEQPLTTFYERNPEVHYTAISHHQASLYSTLNLQTIHHGLDFRNYRMQVNKDGYLCFLGRIAPIKGTHLAIQIAQRTGVPLKIAGEIQPIFRDYYETLIKPHVDGKFIEYVGEVDLEAKNQLLGGAMAMLFPIQWDEPFGLVLIESMACGTPVFALPGGAVREIVADGISGRVCPSVEEMATAITTDKFSPEVVRNWAETMFSLDTMVERYVDLYEMILKKKPTRNHKIIRPQRETAA